MSHGRRVLIEPEIGPSTISPATLATRIICRVSSSTAALTSDSPRITPITSPSSTTGRCGKAIVVLEPGALLDRRIRIDDSDY